jgi:hypothetical protein
VPVLFEFDAGMMMSGWRVFWLRPDAMRTGLRGSVLTGWEDLPSCEAEAGMLAGDPVFLSPDHRVDALLGAYGRSRAFRRFTTARPGCGRWIS